MFLASNQYISKSKDVPLPKLETVIERYKNLPNNIRADFKSKLAAKGNTLEYVYQDKHLYLMIKEAEAKYSKEAQVYYGITVRIFRYSMLQKRSAMQLCEICRTSIYLIAFRACLRTIRKI